MDRRNFLKLGLCALAGTAVGLSIENLEQNYLNWEVPDNVMYDEYTIHPDISQINGIPVENISQINGRDVSLTAYETHDGAIREQMARWIQIVAKNKSII